MKRIICLITVLCLVFGSFSFAFAADATWSTTDSQNLSNVAGRLYYMNNSAAYYLYNIATNTQNTYNKLVDIYNSLFYGNHNITYWVNSISTWMSPIFNAITNIPVDMSTIIGALGYSNNSTYYPYLNSIYKSLTNTYYSSPDHPFDNILSAHNYFVGSDGNYTLRILQANGGYNDITVPWINGSPLGNIAFLLKFLNENLAMTYNQIHNHGLNNYADSQTYINWATLQNSSFTPTSQTNGIYNWLKNIQAPTARLAYVLASDERIAAQEAAADNEEAVVDNFIDSSGSGAASTSDISSISDLSYGYKSNFGSDASVTGLFNIFNSNNMGWFSSETYNQLDTTSNNRRTISDSLPDTPLLDQKINDIYEAIGLDNDR